MTYFCHDTMRYFAQELLGRSYEPISSPRSVRLATYHLDEGARACWSRADPLAMRVLSAQNECPCRPGCGLKQYLSCILRPQRLDPLFNLCPTYPEGLVVYPRDAALVVVLLQRREVWKVSKFDCAVPALIQNEVVASKHAGSLSFPPIDYHFPENGRPGYVVYPYAENDRR